MYIQQLDTFLPDFCYEQEALSDWMIRYLEPNRRDSRVLKMIYNRSKVQNRYSVLPDFGQGSARLFGNGSNPSVEERMEVYFDEGNKLISRIDLDQKTRESITDVIFISCTGIAAPGMDVALIKQLGLNHSVNRLSIHYMGCYAFVTGLRQAGHICKSKTNAKVLIVSLELCTLHLQKSVSYDAIASAALFGDGMAMALVSSENDQKHQWEIGNSFSALHHDSEDLMSWDVTSTGFRMGLNQDVPEIIGEVCSSMNSSDDQDWAIHPGGRKILESFENGVGVAANQLSHSYEVMGEAGNMSSATIAFVLKKMKKTSTKNKIQVLAFGPGLVAEGIQLIRP